MIPAHHEKLGFKKENLICRCFGVYVEQLEELVREKPNSDLKDVTNELNAGGGCATCRNDIKINLN